MNKLTTSLDWEQVRANIEAPVHKLKSYSGEMLLMSRNIALMVTKLSTEEIACRRTQKQTRKHKELIDIINAEIENYQQLVTFAVLLAS
jgi:hypothetical protein